MILRNPGQPCQVASRYDHVFTCDYSDSLGYICENLDPDHGDNHWYSGHTIQHAKAGNGYSCGPVAEGTTPSQDSAIAAGEEYFVEDRLDPQEHPIPFGIRDTVGILKTLDRSVIAYTTTIEARNIVTLLNKSKV